MGPVVRTVSWVLLFAAVGAAAAAWFTPTPEVDADAAVDAARAALAEADVRSELVEAPRRGVHETADGEDIPAWFVDLRASVDGREAPIHVRVQRSVGQLVYLDDRVGPERAEALLSDAQFDVLRAHRVDDNPRDRWLLRNALGAVSAVLIAGTCYVLATRSDRLWSLAP